MLLLTGLILLTVIFFAAYVFQSCEGFESGSMLLSKVPDLCSDLGTKTDCALGQGCVWSEATGMCMKANAEEGFEAPITDCSKITDCDKCAGDDDCGWCKKTGKCYNEDRFGMSGGRCNPESQFITFPSQCGNGIDFGLDANELLASSASSSSSASGTPEPVILMDTPNNRARCQSLLSRPLPNVTNPDLRRQMNDLRSQCTTLMNKSDFDVSESPINSAQPVRPPVNAKAELNVKFGYDEIPTFNERLRLDIQRLLQTLGI